MLRSAIVWLTMVQRNVPTFFPTFRSAEVLKYTPVCWQENYTLIQSRSQSPHAFWSASRHVGSGNEIGNYVKKPKKIANIAKIAKARKKRRWTQSPCPSQMSNSWVRCQSIWHPMTPAHPRQEEGIPCGWRQPVCRNHAAWQAEDPRLLRQPWKKRENMSPLEEEIVPHAAVWHHLCPHGQTFADRPPPGGWHCSLQNPPQGSNTVSGDHGPGGSSSWTTIPAVCSPRSLQHHQLDLSRPRQQTARMILPVMGRLTSVPHQSQSLTLRLTLSQRHQTQGTVIPQTWQT